jgi:hypothetical protein
VTPDDRAHMAEQVRKLSALLRESGVEIFTAVQASNPHRCGRDPVWPTPLFVTIDYLNLLS